VRCELDPHSYPKGITVSDQEMAALNITRAAFRGEWNYTIRPSTTWALLLGCIVSLPRVMPGEVRVRWRWRLMRCGIWTNG
jgi:ABC-type sulfate transport system permease subunit